MRLLPRGSLPHLRLKNFLVFLINPRRHPNLARRGCMADGVTVMAWERGSSSYLQNVVGYETFLTVTQSRGNFVYTDTLYGRWLPLVMLAAVLLIVSNAQDIRDERRRVDNDRHDHVDRDHRAGRDRHRRYAERDRFFHFLLPGIDHDHPNFAILQLPRKKIWG